MFSRKRLYSESYQNMYEQLNNSVEDETVVVQRPEMMPQPSPTTQAGIRLVNEISTHDRFIPKRLEHQPSIWDTLEHPVQWPESSHGQYIMSNMYNMDRAIFESSNIMPIRQSACKPPPPLTPFHAINQSIAALSLNKKQPSAASITLSAILDAPGMLNDYYANILAWSDTDRYFVPIKENQQTYIFSALAAPHPHNKKMIQFETVADLEPYSLAALGANRLISGWEDGSIRIHQIEKPNQPERTMSNCTHYKIHAIVVTSPDTCMIGNEVGELMRIDFRTPTGLAQSINANTPLPGGSNEKIIGLAYAGSASETASNGSSHYLATGSNNNMVRLWDSRDLRRPLQSNTTHNADVKALAFQPDSDHYLLSGGGTKDQQLCLWNTRTAQPEYTVKTGTQITGLVWHTSDYCVSSHGYSSPGVTLWNINNKSMSKKAEHQIPTKTSHDRALCLAGSKTSPYVATTMSNESLRFFKCDPKTTKSKSTKDNTSMLSTHAMFQSGR